jgi:hypothetical protein
MIRIHDPNNLLPHLFLIGEPFEPCIDDADVEIRSSTVPHEIPNRSNVFTIFINTEPDIHSAVTCVDYQQSIDKRPNSVFAITATSPHPEYQWPFPTVEFWSNMYFTFRQAKNLKSLTVEEKPYDACGLFGGWEAGRALMLEKLQEHNLVDRCLINLQPKWNDHLRFTEQDRLTHQYYRSEKILELDDPEFVRLSYTDNGLFTMNIVGPHRYSWASQKIPYNIYNQVYWNIVAESESYPFYDTIYISEKISKPLIAGQPILVFGGVGYLKYLKAHGFKTFDRWVDESYDEYFTEDRFDEHYKVKRATKMIDTFKDFVSQSSAKKFEQFVEMQEVCDHNKKLATDPAFLLAPIVKAIKSYTN